ncbi:hypothetical protein [Sneathiella aquimaris]|uniref:hypothetical protein n=1 Tax=Sneathiella aquimaris TaxID=2599305 RepID=UPI00146A94A2|nr:hypothetical protein [Sneathiella aquimaris]
MATLDWANQTTAHPVGLGLMAVCAGATLVVRREYAIFPLLIMIMAIPSAQRIVVATIDFSFIRILVMAALFRAFMRKEQLGLTRQTPDIAIIFWMVWGIFSYGLLFGTVSAFITRTGFMLDAVGSYYLGRIYVRNVLDLKRVMVFLGIASIPMFMFFSIERATGQNLFSIFGGVPKYTLIRDGRLRCQGPFSHPIMAGVFWAVLLPWLGSFWITKQIPKILLITFAVCFLGIVLNSASSTPVMSVVFVVIGMGFYLFRGYLTQIRWLAFFTLIALHMVMQKPVWHLISRIDITGGSTGWHRYYLIDRSIAHFHEWWLFGVQSTAHWGRGLQDVTNQFILEGVRSGAFGLILFCVFVYTLFKLYGRSIKAARQKSDRWIMWGAGVILFVHCMNFLAVSYFGQMQNAFYLLLGASVSIGATIIQRTKKMKRQEAIVAQERLA